MRRFFQRVDEQLNICYKGQWYFIKKCEGEQQYNKILDKLSHSPLKDEHFEDALSELGLFKVQQNKELRIDKGNIFINDTKTPRIFTEIINNSLANNVSVDYLIKFFKNLLFDTNYKEDKEVRKKVKNLFNSSAYCPDKKSQVVFMDKINEYRELPFYSYAKLPNVLKEIFRKEMSIEDMCKEFYGEAGKTFTSYTLEQMLDHETKEINPKILLYLVAFKNILSWNNLKEVYEKDYLKNAFEVNQDLVSRISVLNDVLKNFTEKKVVSFLKKGFDIGDISYIVSKYAVVSRIHNISEIKFLTIKELRDFMERESFKIESGDNFPLNQEDVNPCLKEIHGKTVEGTDLVCVVPKVYYELISWSQTMGNCIGQGTGYAKKALQGRCVLIGFTQQKIEDYKPEEIFYNLEIVNGNIVQFEARHVRGRGVSASDRQAVTDFLIKAGLLKKRK